MIRASAPSPYAEARRAGTRGHTQNRSHQAQQTFHPSTRWSVPSPRAGGCSISTLSPRLPLKNASSAALSAAPTGAMRSVKSGCGGAALVQRFLRVVTAHDLHLYRGYPLCCLMGSCGYSYMASCPYRAYPFPLRSPQSPRLWWYG